MAEDVGVSYSFRDCFLRSYISSDELFVSWRTSNPIISLADSSVFLKRLCPWKGPEKITT